MTEPDPSAETVAYSGTDFDVEGLVRRLNRGDVVIPSFGTQSVGLESAAFQRNFVWKRPQMDRFIESLLLGYPIPGIMLVEQKDRRYLVLDGQQRLRTLQAFYAGVHAGTVFSLSNVADPFKGLTYGSLPTDLRRTLDNTFIQATIVKNPGDSPSMEAVYQVFERLNSGGTQLTPHEIRMALYAGPFIDWLSSLNLDENWRALYGAPSPRVRDQELILRIVALYSAAATYKRPQRTFLNNFVESHRDLSNLQTDAIEQRFREACAQLAEVDGRTVLRRGGSQINAAWTEAVFVGLMRRLETGPIDMGDLALALESLSGDAAFGLSISRATADEESVRTRLAVASRTLARI